MNTITKTHLVTDVTVGGTALHRVPTIRWTIRTDDAVAHLDIVAYTAIVGYHGDRRTAATLLAHLAAMGLDLDVNENDQHLEWMIGLNGTVWAVAPETIIDHCKAALATYQDLHPVA
jgi:hypothetical protein